MRKRLLFALFALFAVYQNLAVAQSNKSVLFLGNSYTATFTIPLQVSVIATHFGDTLDYDEYTPGGYTFQGHSTDPTSIAKIQSRPWDMVVLQEQSQRPALSPSYVNTYVFPYADSLNRIIMENDSCTTIMFYMTWGRKNGDASNCAAYPPVCTYEGMQERLRTRYLQLADLYGECAPVGAAWSYTRINHPSIELYNADESHPSANGAYLAACVFYASVFHKSPVGGPFGSVDPFIADTLQQVAAHIVLDSFPNWYIDTTAPAAAFTASLLSDSTYSFANASTSATSWWWDFGDPASASNTSSDENPTHTFSGDGTYIVTLIAMRGCLADTIMDTVTVVTVGTELVHSPEFSVWQSEDGNSLILQSPVLQSGAEFELYSAAGSLVRQTEISSTTAEISIQGLPSGIYLARLSNRSLSGEMNTVMRKIWIRR